jgi:arylsulfatase A-like enzyme
MGWADVGFNGSRYYETPNIDRFAARSTRFPNGYAACAVCSPSRAAIMTGKYPARLHITDWIPGEGGCTQGTLEVPKWQQFLPLEEVTIAEALKGAGYATASIGKWHLGGPAYYPEKQGFDVNVAGGHTGHPASYFYPYGPETNSHHVPGLAAGGKPGEYLTDRLTEEAQGFIKANKDKPFFLYLAHYAVHDPIQGKPELVRKYKAKTPPGEQRNPAYAAMVQSVDESFGALVKTLEEQGIADRTIIIFTSDNGGAVHFGKPPATSNAPLRAGKGFPYEGGLREPTFVYWPGVTKGGNCEVPVCGIDFYPTLLEMSGTAGDAEYNKKVDGVSLVPLLRGMGTLKRDALFWHYPHYWNGGNIKPYGVVRQGDWKLIEFYETNKVELYDLKKDIGEKDDLAAKMPEKAAELRKRLHDWLQSVGAQMPTPKSK